MAGKSRLGTVVHQKTAAILAFTHVRDEDKAALATQSATIKVITPNSNLKHR
jgi:large subunit ribosomal protein L7Ae